MKLRKGINFLAADLLTEPIEVFQPVLVTDGEGGFSVTLNKTADIWGMLVPEGNDRTLIRSGGKLYPTSKGIRPLPPHH